MNILLIQNSFPSFYSGGAESSCRDLVLHLNRRGHSVNVLTSDSGDIEGAKTIYNDLKAFPKVSSAIELENIRNKFKWLMYSRRNYFRTRCLIDKLAPDVIYLHNLEWTTPAPLLAAIDSGKRVVVHARNLHYADLWKYAKGGNKRPFYNNLFKLDISFNGVRIITVSNFLKQKFIDNGFPARRITTVYNGISLVDIPSAEPQIKKKRRAVFVGVISPHKGCHIAIEALGILKQQGIELPLDIYGHVANNEYYEKCLSLSRKYNMSNIVKFHGDQKRKIIYEALISSEYFLFPSICEEAFGRVAVEAMACGSIVVGSNLGGIPEVVGDCGVISVPTAQGFAGAIKQLIEQPQQINQEIRKRAVTRVRANYQLSSTVIQTEKILMAT